MARYLDPKSDIVFKKIFGDHLPLLKSFLNAVLPFPDERRIESLEHLPTEQIPSIPLMKRTIVDVKCTDTSGRIFIVEMQVDWVVDFKQRMLFNSAHAYVKQLFKGEDFKSLYPVYGIGILNQSFDPDPIEWYHHYKIVNVKKPSQVLEGLELLFLELPKFKPTSFEQNRLCSLWLRFLTEIDEQTKLVDPALLSVPEIEEACKLSEKCGYTPGELEWYDRYWDHVSTQKTLMRSKFEEGIHQGIAKGLEQGRVEGLAEGITQGFEQGRLEGERKLLEKKLEFATQMLQRGLSPEETSTILGLGAAEVQQLLKKMKAFI